ncbi:glycosyltransferase family 2 protein [Grimontia hollisae]|uniref:glycosyltransferase family 2 protein n=1 Tax=Grimontia hollisae TaxID=673 RepID=UPI001303F0F2|nr:glycosyltransferase family 2 protein [Grimontia hollisae]
MLVSIITTFYNAEKTIQDTIDSIADQSYKNIEVIFVDGLSSDNSLKIVKSNLKRFSNYKLISEKDDGIYDGMNKGIMNASGDIIAILNADDIYSHDAIENVVNLFTKELDLLACTINKFNKVLSDGVVIKRSEMKPLSPLNPTVHHPGIFVRRQVYDKYGLFDLRYRISADFDFIGRIINKGVKIGYTDLVTTHMRSGGASDSFKFHFKKNLEHIIIGYRNRTSKFQFLKYAFYVLKKFVYGLLVFLKLK